MARVAAGLSYAELAPRLDARGFALRNLASLPHISAAGATATATHGSGVANQNLAAAVAGLTQVTADGDVVELRRGGDGFDGAVVHLGALGVVVSLILDLVPSFDVSQRVYENLPMAALDDHFAGLMAGGYSVSLFTDWRAPRLTQIWIKQRTGAPAPRPSRRPGRPPGLVVHCCCGPRGAAPGARRVAGRVHRAARRARPVVRPAPAFPARIPGPAPATSSSRSTCSPSAHAVPALHALDQIRDRLAPVLQICEIRAIAADELWLSTSYRQDSVAFHFTWIAEGAPVLPVVALLERQLAPFGPRPHWGKLFTTTPEDLRARYERLPDFLGLMRRFDPSGKFRNAYTDRYLGTNGSGIADM